MARILTFTANPLLNYCCEESIQAEKVNRVSNLAPQAEGKGVNVARLLSRFGHDTYAAGFVGGHHGALFTDLVAASGVACAFTCTAAELRIGFMARGSRSATTIFAHGFAVSSSEMDQCCHDVDQLLPSMDLFIIAGSVPGPTLHDLYARLTRLAARHGITTWCDGYGSAMDQALQDDAPIALCKPNRQEYETSTHWRRAQECHITDGGGSGIIYGLHGDYRLTPAPVSTVNEIGCGDSYISGLAHARLSGFDQETQYRWAAAAGAVNASRQDVCNFDSEACIPLLNAVQIHQLG